MIKQIFLPRLDANTIEAVVREWYKKENEQVTKGEKLLAIETDKATIDIESEHTGILLKTLAGENEVIPIPCTVGLLGDSVEEKDTPEFQREIQAVSTRDNSVPVAVVQSNTEEKQETGKVVVASPAARRLAKEMGIELAKISGSGSRGEITARDVMALTSNLGDNSSPIKIMQQKKKVLVIGAGDGGYIISDILGFEPQKYEIVGFLDDKLSLWGQEIRGNEIIGGTDRILTLKQQGFFDCLVISITSNMGVRKRIFEKYREMGFEFINVIHPTVHINPSAKIGISNLIYGMAYIGTETKIGDNNLISAHTSIDHHNTVGSHNLFGPGCLTSGAVTIGDSCIFGAGIGIEPHLKIGNNVKVATGLAITSHVPDGITLKGKFSVGV